MAISELGLPDGESRDSRKVCIVGGRVCKGERLHHRNDERIVGEQPRGGGETLGSPEVSKRDRFNCNVEGGNRRGRDLVVRELLHERRIFFEFSDGRPGGEFIGLEKPCTHGSQWSLSEMVNEDVCVNKDTSTSRDIC